MSYKLIKLREEAKRGTQDDTIVEGDETENNDEEELSVGSFQEDIHPYVDRQVGVTKNGAKSIMKKENKVKNKNVQNVGRSLLMVKSGRANMWNVFPVIG